MKKSLTLCSISILLISAPLMALAADDTSPGAGSWRSTETPMQASSESSPQAQLWADFLKANTTSLFLGTSLSNLVLRPSYMNASGGVIPADYAEAPAVGDALAAQRTNGRFSGLGVSGGASDVLLQYVRASAQLSADQLAGPAALTIYGLSVSLGAHYEYRQVLDSDLYYRQALEVYHMGIDQFAGQERFVGISEGIDMGSYRLAAAFEDAVGQSGLFPINGAAARLIPDNSNLNVLSHQVLTLTISYDLTH